MTKKVLISHKPARPGPPVRLWEAEEDPIPPRKRPTKRMTFDLDAEVHLRMKLDCTRRGVNMADEIRRIIEERFPNTPRP